MSNSDVLELGKMLSDFFGQITTLDVAMMAAVVTLVEKVFTRKRILASRHGVRVFSAGLMAFVVSLFFSLYSMMSIPNNIGEMLKDPSKLSWIGVVPFYGSTVFSFIGIILFFYLAYLAVWANLIDTTTKEPIRKKSSRS